MTAQIELTESEEKALDHLAQQTGKAPEVLIQEAVRRYLGQSWQEDWRAALRQTQGIWKDRDDLPSLEELRGEWERPWITDRE
jgi:predicted DNA-binding protein